MKKTIMIAVMLAVACAPDPREACMQRYGHIAAGDANAVDAEWGPNGELRCRFYHDETRGPLTASDGGVLTDTDGGTIETAPVVLPPPVARCATIDRGTVNVAGSAWRRFVRDVGARNGHYTFGGPGGLTITSARFVTPRGVVVCVP